MKTLLFFVGLQIVCSLAFLMPPDDCPEVEVDPKANATTECRPCFDCGYLRAKCCPNKCGTRSCRYLRNHCMVDGKTYFHHKPMPLPNNFETDECGLCWCHNGEKQCELYSCKGGPPLPGKNN